MPSALTHTLNTVVLRFFSSSSKINVHSTLHKLKRYPQRKPKKQETGSGSLRRLQASEVSEGDVSTRLHRQFYSRPR